MLLLNVVDMVYFFVFMDNYDCEEECFFDDNNCFCIDLLVIIVIFCFDFVVVYLMVLDVVSNWEWIDI